MREIFNSLLRILQHNIRRLTNVGYVIRSTITGHEFTQRRITSVVDGVAGIVVHAPFDAVDGANSVRRG